MPLPTTLFVGTDVSQATNRTRFFDGAGDEVGRRYQSANDLPGSKALAAEALGRADPQHGQVRAALPPRDR